jgi:electron transport complex protein RnfB
MPAMRPTSPTLADRIDALLPQTQCTKCGYAGCRPYAEAMAQSQAPLNQCPPGGQAGIAQLAALLGRPALPLNPAHGVEAPRAVAVIDEQHCIGCTLCIQACPVDAILGAPKLMHAIIPELCTGCDLCVAPCPVDCISMQTLPAPAPWTASDAQAARHRMQARQARLVREKAENDVLLAERAQDKLAALAALRDPGPDPERDRKRAVIEAALARARARRGAGKAP